MSDPSAPIPMPDPAPADTTPAAIPPYAGRWNVADDDRLDAWRDKVSLDLAARYMAELAEGNVVMPTDNEIAYAQAFDWMMGQIDYRPTIEEDQRQ